MKEKELYLYFSPPPPYIPKYAIKLLSVMFQLIHSLSTSKNFQSAFLKNLKKWKYKFLAL